MKKLTILILLLTAMFVSMAEAAVDDVIVGSYKEKWQTARDGVVFERGDKNTRIEIPIPQIGQLQKDMANLKKEVREAKKMAGNSLKTANEAKSETTRIYNWVANLKSFFEKRTNENSKAIKTNSDDIKNVGENMVIFGWSMIIGACLIIALIAFAFHQIIRPRQQ